MISDSEMVNGGDNLKLSGCERNQKLISPFSRHLCTTFSTLSKDFISNAYIIPILLISLISSHQHLKEFTYNPMLGHITTFGGHPVNCAAANACLEVMEN